MENTYELVTYEQTEFIIGVKYGRPNVRQHLHREMEIGLILEGEGRVTVGDRAAEGKPGDIWLANPWQSHEIRKKDQDARLVFLVLQVPSAFFSHTFPQIGKIRLEESFLTQEKHGDAFLQIRERLLDTACAYMRAEPYYELRCAAGIDLLMEQILWTVSHTRMSDEETQLLGTKMRRMQRLEEYIQEHYAEPLRLTDLAQKEGLTLNYLSHFFRDCFGLPFQTYLLNLRCRAAAQMLTQTDLSVSEVSYACGFSALKYMNRGFLDQYGVKPGEYRTQFSGSRRSAEQTVQQKDAGEPIAVQRLFFPPALPREEGLAHLTRALQRGF